MTLPHFTNNSPALLGVALGIATAALTAGALVQVLALNKTESPGAIAFYFALASSVAGLATLPLGWSMPDASVWILLVLNGVFGGSAHIAMTLAFRYAEASFLAPFEYLTILWAAAIDAAIFAEIPGFSFMIAAPLVVAGAFLASPGILLGLRRGRLRGQDKRG